MPINSGTYDISSLLAARFQSVAAFGMSTVRLVLDADIAAHNQIVQELMLEFCEITTDRQRIYGTSQSGDMVEVDEYGRAPAKRQNPGATVGFPMKNFQFNLGWTAKWLQTRTPADVAISVQGAEKAHLRAIQLELKRAIFRSANYVYRDHLVDNIDFNIKRFINADSSLMADGPNGENFDGSSHTHYLARAGGSLAASDVTSLINTVVEHGFGGSVKLAISRTDEATFRALTGFTAYIDPRLINGTFANQPGQRLDISRMDNRAIGIFGAAEVWVKPWCLANYCVCWDTANPNKPLAFRQRNETALQGLRIAAEYDDYPLQAQFMEAEFGMGVWTRTNGGVLYFGNTSYADPTI
ncbi:MAG: hypothetical protein P4L50_03310 [Anaerolineaceae bacterium]|nr:hypothetical protein [Anaerolineaceae bacterium]